MRRYLAAGRRAFAVRLTAKGKLFALSWNREAHGKDLRIAVSY
jgi:hypothetical protein